MESYQWTNIPPLLSADLWPRVMETEIGAALCTIQRGKDFYFFVLFMKIAQATFRTTESNIGLFILVLMHFPC